MSTLGNLTVITGPSGVGKGTIVRKILDSHSDVWLSISATTRQPRSGEIDGEHYFFLDKKTFQAKIDIVSQLNRSRPNIRFSKNLCWNRTEHAECVCKHGTVR